MMQGSYGAKAEYEDILKGTEGKHGIPELITSYFKFPTGINISVPSQW
jgi:hypothetical protein